MNLREFLEILDERVELIVYDSDGLHTMHLYDKDYFYHWHEEFLKKKVVYIEPYRNAKAKLEVYLKDYYVNNNAEEEI